jgi:hypothetical protein
VCLELYIRRSTSIREKEEKAKSAKNTTNHTEDRRGIEGQLSAPTDAVFTASVGAKVPFPYLEELVCKDDFAEVELVVLDECARLLVLDFVTEGFTGGIIGAGSTTGAIPGVGAASFHSWLSVIL